MCMIPDHIMTVYAATPVTLTELELAWDTQNKPRLRQYIDIILDHFQYERTLAAGYISYVTGQRLSWRTLTQAADWTCTDNSIDPAFIEAMLRVRSYEPTGRTKVRCPEKEAEFEANEFPGTLVIQVIDKNRTFHRIFPRIRKPIAPHVSERSVPLIVAQIAWNAVARQQCPKWVAGQSEPLTDFRMTFPYLRDDVLRIEGYPERNKPPDLDLLMDKSRILAWARNHITADWEL